ncbi:MAG: hypothetical protein PHH11_17800 [Methylomonas sp.]|nr:hypothetical protein [Methylomonas sp.]
MSDTVIIIVGQLFLGYLAGWGYFLVAAVSFGAFLIQWQKSKPEERFLVLFVQVFKPTPYLALLGVTCLYWALTGNPSYWFWLGFAGAFWPLLIEKTDK